jgi:carbon-monoxide dehydrogenase large subunit
MPDDTHTGDPVPRREDDALLRGRAAFTDDRTPADTAYVAFARSDHAHAALDGVDLAPAERVDGVLAACDWAALRADGVPGRLETVTDPIDADVPGQPVLAADCVRYHGQPVAAVLGETRQAARDGAAAVAVDYDPLPAVVDPVEATGGDAPELHDGAPGNVAFNVERGDEAAVEDALADADHVVERDLSNNRLAPLPLEPRSVLVEPSGDRLTVTLATQTPHGQRESLVGALGIPETDVRVVAPSVGGGFGQKDTSYPEKAVVAWLARETGRPAKWTATRGESLLAGNHGRDNRATAALGVDDDGTIRALRVDTHSAAGAYLLGAAGFLLAEGYQRPLTGQYDVPAAYCETTVAFTNTAPVHTYRGGVVPEAIHVIERLAGDAARELGLDPVEFRRRNVVPGDTFPYDAPFGGTYDSGDYRGTLDAAADALASERPTDPDDGRLRGVGYAAYLDMMPAAYESGSVRVEPDGSVTALAGSHSHGQGHATTYAQIVADELGVPMDTVDVVEGDTDRVPSGNGTWGSRSTIAAGNAVRESARDVATDLRRLAAHRFDCSPDDVTLADGTVMGPSDEASFAAVAGQAYGPNRPEDLSPGLEATTYYEADAVTYTFGTHAVAVAVDPATGEYEVEAYVAVDDCGPRVNPAIVDGQIQGSVAQGVGQARFEEAVYGDDGRLATDSMRDYGVPRAFHVPNVASCEHVTPAPTNDLGVRGVGEVGTVAAPPAVVNAVLDALPDGGPDDLAMPVRSEDVLDALRAAE